MPAQNGRRLHHLDQVNEVGPEPDQSGQQYSVDTSQTEACWYPPQRHVQLETEQQILGFQPPARLEQVGDNEGDGVQGRKHRY